MENDKHAQGRTRNKHMVMRMSQRDPIKLAKRKEEVTTNESVGQKTQNNLSTDITMSVSSFIRVSDLRRIQLVDKLATSENLRADETAVVTRKIVAVGAMLEEHARPHVDILFRPTRIIPVSLKKIRSTDCIRGETIVDDEVP